MIIVHPHIPNQNLTGPLRILLYRLLLQSSVKVWLTDWVTDSVTLIDSKMIMRMTNSQPSQQQNPYWSLTNWPRLSSLVLTDSTNKHKKGSKELCCWWHTDSWLKPRLQKFFVPKIQFFNFCPKYPKCPIWPKCPKCPKRPKCPKSSRCPKRHSVQSVQIKGNFMFSLSVCGVLRCLMYLKMCQSLVSVSLLNILRMTFSITDIHCMQVVGPDHPEKHPGD